MACLLGIDLGSSSVKVSVLDVATGRCVGTAFHPSTEQKISSPQPGFAEQDPAMWFENTCIAARAAVGAAGVGAGSVQAIGISYQMHGLVCVDGRHRVLRPAIIWCDSRAVPYGQSACEKIGRRKCLLHLLNSPGNFTASKLAWVKENEPATYGKIGRIMLPGDWLAMKLTGEVQTTVSGLSEGIFWDFRREEVCGFLLDHFGFDPALLPDIAPTFGIQGRLKDKAAEELGLKAGIPVAYRAGDQPNNAFSLNVLKPGEVAATAGTSGVVYGVTAEKTADPESRVNTFVHVNHSAAEPRLGVLLCINGAGILNAWTKRLTGCVSYAEMNRMAATVPPGSDGLTVLPFGNGAERMLGNRNIGALAAGLDFNRHDRAHVCRAAQEGVAFAFRYGMDAMKESGIALREIRAGHSNMFLSDVFCETLAGVSGASIRLYNTDGSLGAARGAGVGAGVYASPGEAFGTLNAVRTIEPSAGPWAENYEAWKKSLDAALNNCR